MKEIEQRVQSLYGVLTSPVREDDYAENARRIELQRSVLIWTYVSILIPLSGDSTGLSRSLDHSLKNMYSFNFYRILITPKS
jgi:hypothetical protein